MISDTELVDTSSSGGAGPAAIAASPRLPAAYVGHTWQSTDKVSVICELAPVDGLAVGQNPIALAVKADKDQGKDYVYVAERGEDRVAIIEITGACPALTATTIMTVPVGQDPTAVTVHPQTGLIYVVNGGSSDVSVISGTEFLTTIPTGGGNPGLGPSTFSGYVLNGSTDIIAFGPETGYVYVSNWVSDTVSVISRTEVISALAVGHNPNSIVASPFSGRVYVANTADSTVSVINHTAVLTTLAVVSYPIEMAVHPQSGDVYVVGRDGDAVTVIRELEVIYLPIVLKQFPFIGNH